MSLLIKNADVFIENRLQRVDVAIDNGVIADIGQISSRKFQSVWEATGLTVLPGFIDAQVHFREPGLEHKEDIESGTRAAALGGITAVLEMPNTKPATTTEEALQDKVARAFNRAHVDIGFFIGASGENSRLLPHLETRPGCPGVKVFMGSSTGHLLVSEDELLEMVFRFGKKRITVHAEDESRLLERKSQIPPNATAEYHPIWRDEETALRATIKAVTLAEKYRRPVHILHVSSQAEMLWLAQQKKRLGSLLSVETLPQFFLMAAPECYQKLGSLVQMNPPIRGPEHQSAVWNAIINGTVDIIATDHAPHTRDEKSKPYPQSPSGMPGVQTLAPLMLDQVHQGRLSLSKVVELCSYNPARLYGIKPMGKHLGAIKVGRPASLTVVDLKKSQTILDSQMAYKVGWTPWNERRVTGWPVGTIVRGHIVMRDGELPLIQQPIGQALNFE